MAGETSVSGGTSSSGTSTVTAKGDPGEAGEAGAQGAQGERGAPGRSTSRTINTAPARMILGLMVFTMVIALVGGELEKNQGSKKTIAPFDIIFGGTVATSLLTLLAHAGEPGEKLAVGLAAVAFTGSALVYGKPVWDRLNQQFGTSPTPPIGGTSPTAPTTTPTATTAAIAPAVLGGV